MELKVSACFTSSAMLQSCSSLSDAAHKLALIQISCVTVAPEFPQWTLGVQYYAICPSLYFSFELNLLRFEAISPPQCFHHI